MSIRVYRTSDRTAEDSDFGRELDNARLSVAFDAYVCFAFKGTEKSTFSVLIESDSFADVARAMMKADASEAIKAFGAALAEGLPEPIKRAA